MRKYAAIRYGSEFTVIYHDDDAKQPDIWHPNGMTLRSEMYTDAGAQEIIDVLNKGNHT